MKLFSFLGLLVLGLQMAGADLASVKVADGFARPVWVGAPTSEKGKLWVMEQEGKVWIIDLKTGKKMDEPFLDISHLVTRKSNEQGLLGLDFAPNFAKSGRYYVNYNEKGGDTHIVRFTSADGVTTKEGSGELLLKFEQPYGNHNGGWLGFGPDGLLYIATGDGGSANDPKNLAQNMDSLLGKLLRIDVSGEKGYSLPTSNPFLKDKNVRPEIIASGLRNPWRCSFDWKTDQMWIADVGQNAFEEVNVLKRSDLNGKNFGWRLREGAIKTPKKKIAGEAPKNHVEPIYTYSHGGGDLQGKSVTGGYVYRGVAIPSLAGKYVFADYQNPRIWSFVEKGGKVVDFQDHTSELQPKGGRINLVSSFGTDANGELYLVDHSGVIYRIVEK